ncbi:MAG: hypothetical protein HZB82_07475 [Deltaproteobacteria bacterium]|nr:hypothetical protein [Deltaproteobacteria bacterium]
MRRKIAAWAACLFLLCAAAHVYAGVSDDLKDVLLGAPEDSSGNGEKGPEADKRNIKEAAMAGVKAAVGYLNPEDAAGPRFKVSLDSASADLGKFRFERHITLRDSDGRTYYSDPVQASGTEFHREAVVEFKSAYIGNSYFVDIVISGLTEGANDIVIRFDRQ